MDVSRHYLKVDEVAERLQMDVSGVYKLCKAGQIPSIRIGAKTVRIPALAFERYLERLEGDQPEFSGMASSLPVSSTALEERIKQFEQETGISVEGFVDAWRAREIEDTPENADIAVQAFGLIGLLESGRQASVLAGR